MGGQFLRRPQGHCPQGCREGRPQGRRPQGCREGRPGQAPPGPFFHPQPMYPTWGHPTAGRSPGTSGPPGRQDRPGCQNLTRHVVPCGHMSHVVERCAGWRWPWRTSSRHGWVILNLVRKKNMKLCHLRPSNTIPTPMRP